MLVRLWYVEDACGGSSPHPMGPVRHRVFRRQAVVIVTGASCVAPVHVAAMNLALSFCRQRLLDQVKLTAHINASICRENKHRLMLKGLE